MNARPALFFAADTGERVQTSALASQPFLFSADAGLQERQALLERSGEFTGDRFFLQRPADYAAVVQLLASRVGVKSIAKMVGCSVNTVRAVRRREGISVDTLREKTVAALAEFVADASERLRDEVQELPVAALAVPLGIATEKLQLLNGGATARVEVLQVAPVDAFAAYIESLPTAMGSGAEESRQKASANGGAVVGVDIESPDSPLFAGGIATHHATQSTDSTAAESHTTGGAGVEICPPPPTEPIHSSAHGFETKRPDTRT